MITQNIFFYSWLALGCLLFFNHDNRNCRNDPDQFTQDRNLQELGAFCHEERAGSPSEKIKSLIHNYRKRLQAVIDVEGGKTQYEKLEYVNVWVICCGCCHDDLKRGNTQH